MKKLFMILMILGAALLGAANVSAECNADKSKSEIVSAICQKYC